MRKLTKLTAFIVLALFALILPLTSCSDHDIYFTVDETQEGSGSIKQIAVYRISVSIGEFFVNVQNAEGKVNVTSSNNSIAEAEVLQGYHLPRVALNLKKPGDVIITAIDSKGNTGNLFLTVLPKEE